MNLIVDVKSREEYYENHIKRSLNIPVSDIEYYIDFLKDKDILLSCDTGRRAKIAMEHSAKRAVKAAIIPQEELDKYKKEGKARLCAINYLSVKPGIEQEFEEETKELCRIAYGKKGFLRSKILSFNDILWRKWTSRPIWQYRG